MIKRNAGRGVELGVPWEERDWAKWTDEERDRYLGTSATRPAGSGRPPGGGLRLDRRLTRGRTILAFALIAAGLVYAGHRALKMPSYDPPSVLGDPTRAFSQPPPGQRALPPTQEPIRDLPSMLRRGTYVTSSGTLGSDVSGVVIVEGRWGNGPWYRLASALVTNGSYRVRYLLDRPGLLHLRIALPNGNDLVATTRVT